MDNSKNIEIKVDGQVIGEVFHFEITQEPDSIQIVIRDADRCIGAIQSLETEHKEDEIRIKCGRIRLDKNRLAQSFARDFVHPKSQRLPFHIEIYTNGELSERFENVWLDTMSARYTSGDFIVSDSAEMVAEKVWQAEKEEIVITYDDGTEIGSMDSIEINRETDAIYSRCQAKIICGTIVMKAETGGSPEFTRGMSYNIEIRRNGKTETWLETLWFPENIEHEVLPGGMIRIPAGALMRGKAIWRAGRR